MNSKSFSTYCFVVVIVLFIMLLFCACTQINTYNVSELTGPSVQRDFRVMNAILIGVSTLLFVVYMVIKFRKKRTLP